MANSSLFKMLIRRKNLMKYSSSSSSSSSYSSSSSSSSSGVTYYYVVSGHSTSAVNGNYYLYSGTYGTTDAVYTNGTYYIYYYSSAWMGWTMDTSPNANSGLIAYKESSTEITGSWSSPNGMTVSEYAEESGDVPTKITVSGSSSGHYQCDGEYVYDTTTGYYWNGAVNTADSLYLYFDSSEYKWKIIYYIGAVGTETYYYISASSSNASSIIGTKNWVDTWYGSNTSLTLNDTSEQSTSSSSSDSSSTSSSSGNVIYYYTVSGNTSEDDVNGDYYLLSGTHGTTDAVYTNGTWYMYYDEIMSTGWVIGTREECELKTMASIRSEFYNEEITGTWNEGYGTVVTEYSNASSSSSVSKVVLHVLMAATLNDNNMATSYGSYNGDYVYDATSDKYYLDGDTSSTYYIYYTGTAWAIYTGYENAYTFTSSSDINSISGTHTWSALWSSDGADIDVEIDSLMSYEYDLNITTKDIYYSFDYNTYTQTRNDNGNNSDYTGLFKQILRKLNSGYKGSMPYVVYCKSDDPSDSSPAYVIIKNVSSSSSYFYLVKTTYGNITTYESYTGGYTSSYASLYSYLTQYQGSYYLSISSSSFSKTVCSFRSAFAETSSMGSGGQTYSTFAVSITDVEETSLVIGTITFTENPITIYGISKSGMEIDLMDYTTVSNSKSPTFTGSLPIGLSFDGTAITGTPKYGDTNSYDITVSAVNCDDVTLTIQFAITGEAMQYWNGYIATSSYSYWSGMWEKYTSTTTVDSVTYNTYSIYNSSGGMRCYLYYTKDSTTSKNYWVVSYSSPSNSLSGVTTFSSNNFGYSDFIEGTWTLSSSYSSYGLSFEPAGTITVPSSSVTLSGASGTALTLNLANYVTVSNGNTPTFSGNLPIGLSFSGTSITGTPKYANSDTYSITVSATNCANSTFNIVAAITGTEMTYANSYIGTSNNSYWNGTWTKYTSTTTVDNVTYNTYSFTYSGSTYYMFYTKDTTSSNNYWVICSYSGYISNSMQVTSTSSYNYSNAQAYATYIEGTWTCSSSSYNLSFAPVGTISATQSSANITGQSGTTINLSLASYFTASNGNTITLSGALPMGLSFSGASIVGTPTYADSRTYTINVNASGCESITFSLICAITGDANPYPSSTCDGTQSNPYYWDSMVDSSYGNRCHTISFNTPSASPYRTYFYVYLTAGTSYQMGTAYTSSYDTYVRLFDSSDSQVSYNDDSTATLNNVYVKGCLTYTPSTSGWYKFAVCKYGDGEQMTGITAHMYPEFTMPTTSSSSSSSGGGTGGSSSDEPFIIVSDDSSNSQSITSAACGKYYLYSGTATDSTGIWKHESQNYYLVYSGDQYDTWRLSTSTTGIPLIAEIVNNYATTYNDTEGLNTILSGGVSYNGYTSEYFSGEPARLTVVCTSDSTKSGDYYLYSGNVSDNTGVWKLQGTAYTWYIRYVSGAYGPWYIVNTSSGSSSSYTMIANSYDSYYGTSYGASYSSSAGADTIFAGGVTGSGITVTYNS